PGPRDASAGRALRPTTPRHITKQSLTRPRADRRSCPLRSAAVDRRARPPRQDDRRAAGAIGRRAAGGAFRLRLQGAAVLPAPDRTGRRAARLARRAAHRSADRRHLAGPVRLRPSRRRLHRLASDAQPPPPRLAPPPPPPAPPAPPPS